MPLSLRVTDRATILSTHLSGNRLRRSVIKATADEPTRPPLKHVQRILFSSLFGSFGGDAIVIPPKFFEYLLERLAIHDSWLVVCKTLIVFHVILNEGNCRLVDLLLEDSVSWVWAADRLIGPEFVYTQFVRRYAVYLREKVIAYKTLRATFDLPMQRTTSIGATGSEHISSGTNQPRRVSELQKLTVSHSGSSTASFMGRSAPAVNDRSMANSPLPRGDIRSLSTADMIRIIPVLQNQLDALVLVRLDDESRQNDVTCAVTELVVAELVPLFSQITSGMHRILDIFPTFETEHAIFCLRLYDKYRISVRRAQDLMNMFNMISLRSPNMKFSLPDHVPLDLSPSLREYVLQKGLEKASLISSREERRQEENAIRKAIEDSIRESS
ncbi:hypothetical protein CCYA_CCYA18G4562 [Cyanidiococcus yangmingshanensis]|nr:hypothetical protein CCYA_CCYA18G4562 [Cyanidiococcus yangmingshanensis]